MTLSALDPLNLAGILTPGERVPAVQGNRVVYRDGVPVFAPGGGELAVRNVSAGDGDGALEEPAVLRPA